MKNVDADWAYVLCLFIAFVFSAYVCYDQAHTIAQQKQLIRVLWSDCR